MHNKTRFGGGILLAAALLGAAPLAVAGEESVTLKELLTQEITPYEKEKIKVLNDGLKQAAKGGAASHIARRGWVGITPESGLLKALRKNLTIQVSGEDVTIAREAIREAEAVFDPVLSLSVGYNFSDTHDRTKNGKVRLQNYQAQDVKNIQTDPNDPDAQVTGIYWRRQNSGTVDKEVQASTRPDKGPTKSTMVNVGLYQQLPWGPTLNLSIASDRTPIEYQDGHYWHRPWASSATATLTFPLGKGFGRYAPNDVALRQAKISSERSNHTLKGIINSTLKSVDLAYWDLVQRLENYHVTVQNRRAVGSQTARAQRLYEAQQVTDYGMAQMRAELARVRVTEEDALNNLVVASDNLASLMVDDQMQLEQTIILPLGYEKRLAQTMEVDAKGAVAVALRTRPELMGSELDIQFSKLSLERSRNQAKPNVNVTASGTFSQDNSTLGYKSYDMSLNMLGEPDAVSQSYSANYSRPWQNRAAKAAVEQSKRGLQERRVIRDQMENQVTREVQDALSNLYSSRARVETAKRNERLAGLALSKVREKHDLGAGDVSENELILKFKNHINARYARIAAQIDEKRAETRLRGAQGLLAAEHVESAAKRNAFETHRVNLLAANKVLEYFSPVTVAHD